MVYLHGYRTCECGVALRLDEHMLCVDCADSGRPRDCQFDDDRLEWRFQHTVERGEW